MGGSRPPWPCGLAVLLLLVSASSSDARTLFGDVQRSPLRTAPSGTIVGDGATLVETAPLQNVAASENPSAPASSTGGDIMNVRTDEPALAPYRGMNALDFHAGVIITLPTQATPAKVKAAIAQASKAKAEATAAIVSSQGISAQTTFTGLFDSVLLNGRCLTFDLEVENQGRACMRSPNTEFVVCLEAGGVVVGYRNTDPVWATVEPSAYAGDKLLLCLRDEQTGDVKTRRSAQLVILKQDFDLTVVTTMYQGPDYQLPALYTPAAYIQDDVNLVIYDPGCNALAQTGTTLPRITPPCMSEELDIISGLSNRQFDDPDPSTSGYVGDTDIPREYFDLACPPGLFVTSYNYLTAEADGKQLLVGVTDITCGDAGTLVQPINNQGIEGGWAGNNGDANPTIHPMSIPRGSRFFSPMITINTSAVLLYGQSANLECRAGTLLAGMYGTYAQPGDVNAGETLALMCRSACTQELSSTGAPSDPLRSCTNGTLKINTVGTACNSTCGSGKLTVTCTALGQWNVDSQCAPLSTDAFTGPSAGDRFQPNRVGKIETNFTCLPGTYITGFPIYVDSTTRRLVGIKRIDCSNSDASQTDFSTQTWGGQSGAEVSYELPVGFGRARIESETGAGIHLLNLRRVDFKPTAQNPNRYVAEDAPIIDGPLATPPTTQPLWNVSNENCANGNVAAGVYIRHNASKVFTMGFVCRKVCQPLPVTGVSTLDQCATGINVVGKVCNADCPAGSTGTVTATCTPTGVWQTTGNCTINNLPCRGNPPNRNTASFTCPQANTDKGSSCLGACDAPNGYIGATSATCQGSGSWSYTGTCPELPTDATFTGTTTRVMYTGLAQADADATCGQTGGSVVDSNGVYGCEHDSQVIYMSGKYHIVNRLATYGQGVAQDICRKLGGNLSSFADIEENARFLRELGYDKADYSGLWLGLYASNPTPDTSSYSWISTGQSPSFLWGENEPNGNFSCVKMAAQYGYWADEACRKPYGFTCELASAPVTCPANPTLSLDNGAFDCAQANPGEACLAKCTDGFVGAPRVQCSYGGSWGSVEGGCVQAAPETVVFFNKRWTLYPAVSLSQRASQDFCAATNGTLITVKSAEESARLADKIVGYTRPVWIGLQNGILFPTSEPGNYYWLGSNVSLGWTNWAANQPDGNVFTQEGFCVTAGQADAMWADNPCQDEFIVACEYQNTCQQALPTIDQAKWGSECVLSVAAGLYCNATCAENYEGSPSATCNSTSWVADGTCTPKACPVPENRPNGENFTCPSQAHTSVCTAECSAFYTGSLTATCSFGNWTYVGECTPTNCTADPTTDVTGAGSFTCSNGLAQGSECIAPCIDGYTGNVTATCGSDRSFSNAGTCNPNPCTNLQQQAGANPFTCESVPHGGFCPGECSTFYTGTVNATCSLGTVTYDNQCTSTNCTNTPSTSEHVGAFSCDNGAAYQSTCTAICSDGYTGTVTAICGSDKLFTPTGTCSPNSCSDPAVPTTIPNSLNNNVSDSCTETAHGSNCTVPCKTGYTSSVIVTCDRGIWTWADGKCSPDPCQAAPEASNTNFTTCSSGEVTSGDICPGSCEDGFVASPEAGAPSATCTAGQYQVSGACVPGNCTEGPALQQNATSFPQECVLTHGAVCPGSCETFYAGNVQATCQYGRWTYENTCASTNCTEAPPNSNPASNVGYTCDKELADGSVCKATCAERYSGSGLEATCTNTQWSPTGTCDPNPCANPTVDVPDSVKNVSCNVPAPHGTSCNVDCSPGYTGTVTVDCVLGSFVNVTGTCTATNCTVDPTTSTSEPVGTFDCPNGLAKDSTCTAICSTGYVGTVTATCASRVWAFSGTCTPRGCNASDFIMPHGSAGSLSCGGVGPITHGTTCDVPCATDFNGTVTTSCQFGLWTAPSAQCVRVAGSCPGLPTAWVDGLDMPSPWQDSCRNTRTGQSCTGRCTTGRLATSTPTVQCVLDTSQSNPTGGRWASTATGKCEKVCAGMPTNELANGRWSEERCKDKTVYLQPCVGVCDEENGYFGRPEVQCVPDGNNNLFFSPTVTGACVKGGACRNLPPIKIDNGVWPPNCQDRPVNGTPCVALCNAPRWGGSNPPQVTCKIVNGQPKWDTSSLTGSCQRMCTTRPPADLLSPGSFWSGSCAGNVAAGGVCTALCPSGSYGAPTITCKAPPSDGTWDRTTFTGECQKEPVCPNLPGFSVKNGGWPTQGAAACYNTRVNGTCTAQCSTGFKTTQPAVATCATNADGSVGWVLQNTTALLSCKRVCSGTPDQALLAGVGSWPASCNDSEASCKGECRQGFYGSPTVSCTTNGWSRTVIGRCSNTQVCLGKPNATILGPGVWPNSCADTAVGAPCNAACTYGYGGTDQPKVMCGANGQWAATSSGSCQLVCMGSPNRALLPANGTWGDCTSKVAVGGTCTGNCGSSFAGSPEVECLPGGWRKVLKSGTSCTSTLGKRKA